MAIIYFWKNFNPESVLLDEKKRLIERQNEIAKDIWRQMRISQSNGLSFKILIGADAILFIVLGLNMYEWRLAQKDLPSISYNKLINRSRGINNTDENIEDGGIRLENPLSMES